MFRSKFRKFKDSNSRRPNLDWSEYQKNIFKETLNNENNIMIKAGPGSGKTETIIEGMYYIPNFSDRKILFTAFSADVTRHLGMKIPRTATAASHHAIGLRTTLKHWGHTYNMNKYGCVDKKNDTLFELVNKQIGNDSINEKLRQMLVFATDMCKITLSNTEQEIEQTVCHYGVDRCGMSLSDFTENVFKLLEACKNEPRILNNKSVISFADMIWLPFVHGWEPEQYDYIYVDEGQDLSPARTDLLLNSLSNNGLICIAADPNQAIFSWAGATINGVNKLINKLNAKVLPLSVSYRCAKSIIEVAKAINAEIEAAPNAIEGTVENLNVDELYDVLEPGMAVLSRSNYPLVKLCMSMLANGFNANIQGKDIGQRMNWRIDCWNPSDIKELINAVNSWRDDICSILYAKKRISSVELINDEAACLLQFAENASCVSDVKIKINKFFSDTESQVKLSTAHKAKGLEFKKVLLLEKTFNPNKSEEEKNIYYVAITRAKEYLGFVQGRLI